MGIGKDKHKCYMARCVNCGHVAVISYRTLHRQSKGTCKHPRRAVFHVPRLHATFNAMVDRCYNPRNKAFRFYGGNGVTVCDEWLTAPIEFEQWALANGYADNLTIDRINSNFGYSPANCRWVSGRMNSKWKKTTNHFTVNGITDSGRGWATRLSRSPNFFNAYARSHSKEQTEQLIADILSDKATVGPRQYMFNNEYYTIRDLAVKFNINANSLHSYLQRHGLAKFKVKVQSLFAGGDWVKPSRHEVEIYGVVKTEAEWSRAVHKVSEYFAVYKHSKGIDFAIAKIKQLLQALPDNEKKHLHINC